MFDLVKSLYTPDEYTTSRRSVLQAIATFPMVYLGVKQRRLFNPHPEEFLPECTASIVACWQLLNDEKEGLSIIEAVLPLYLPTLVNWSRQNTRYRQTAASLGSQGNLLMALVAYHRFQFRAYESYCQQAVELAALSMDANLHAYALIWLGSAQAYNGQPQAELERIQEVSHYRARLIPALRCYLLAQAARVYAKQGQVQDALRAIGEARTLFVEKEGLPGFIASDYGPFALLLWEGMTYISLGDNDPGNALKHYKRARSVFAESEKIAPTLFVPGRFDIELVNYRATVAIKEKNLADFLAYLKIGLEGVKTLGSEKRWQEIVVNWRDAQHLWSREAEIVNLADAFH